MARHSKSETYGATDIEAKREANRQLIDYVKREAATVKKWPTTVQ